MNIKLAKQLKELSDEFENENDKNKLRYFIQNEITTMYISVLGLGDKK